MQLRMVSQVACRAYSRSKNEEQTICGGKKGLRGDVGCQVSRLQKVFPVGRTGDEATEVEFTR